MLIQHLGTLDCVNQIPSTPEDQLQRIQDTCIALNSSQASEVAISQIFSVPSQKVDKGTFAEIFKFVIKDSKPEDKNSKIASQDAHKFSKLVARLQQNGEFNTSFDEYWNQNH